MTYHTFNIIDQQRLENCVAHLRSDGLGKECRIGPIRKSRQQESYAHACFKVIADHTGESMEDIKMRIKYSVLPLREINASNGQTYLYPESTVNLDKETYSKLIDAALMIGMMLELKMPDPSYYGFDNRQ